MPRFEDSLYRFKVPVFYLIKPRYILYECNPFKKVFFNDFLFKDTGDFMAKLR